jgi:hypothetical protein
MWMAPGFPDVGRIDVNISSAIKTSRENTCDILRNCGNFERAKGFPHPLDRSKR